MRRVVEAGCGGCASLPVDLGEDGLEGLEAVLAGGSGQASFC